MKPWSANLVASLKDIMIFEDLNALQYRNKNKFQTFDEKHTILALRTLARFHASSILYEESKRKQIGRAYYISEDYIDHLDCGGYEISNTWYNQCMVGALEVVKTYSKYRNTTHIISLIEKRWKNIWENALNLSNSSCNYRNVICHRDLWNNNILFKYEATNNLVPIDCVFVDFQAVKYQPLAGDVMLLLYCNLEPQFRDKNINKFLNYYYSELKDILYIKGVNIENVLSLEDYFKSCNEQRLWGLVVSACLVPQFWIDDELTTKIFTDTEQFQEILTKDKASFIKTMIESNSAYKVKVLQIFEEIVERYCLEK